MKEIADRLREIRQDAGYKTATDAARAFGWNENTYRSNENGQRPPSRQAAVKYARAFRVSVDWLLTGRGPKHSGGLSTRTGSALRQIPIVRWAAITGADTFRASVISADARGFIVIPEGENLSRDAFALEVQDDSMVDPSGSPLSLYAGDTVVIDPDREPLPGNMVLARDGKKAMIRKLRVLSEEANGARVALVPLNPDYATKETAQSAILGVMAGLYRRTT